MHTFMMLGSVSRSQEVSASPCGPTRSSCCGWLAPLEKSLRGNTAPLPLGKQSVPAL